MLLNQLPTDILYNILTFCEDRHNVSAKLLLTSKSFNWYFSDPHMKNLLWKKYPVTVRCKKETAKGICRKHALFRHPHDPTTKDPVRCDKHKEQGMIKTIKTKKDRRKTLEQLASRGYTCLLKILWSPREENVLSYYTFLRDSAIKSGKVECANWIIQQLDCKQLPSVYTVLKYFDARNIEAIKTAFQLGVRLQKPDVITFTKGKVKFRSLNRYIKDDPHPREVFCEKSNANNVIFPSSIWEMRLAFYYCMTDLIIWLQRDYGIPFDMFCYDLLIAAASEDTLPVKVKMFNEFQQLFFTNRMTFDFITLFYGCILDCRKDIFLQAYHSTLLTTNEVNMLGYYCILYDRRDQFECIYPILNGIANGNLLENAIKSNAQNIVFFLVKERGKRCQDGNRNVLPDGWDIDAQSLLYLKTLLTAGVCLPDVARAYEMSMEPHKMYYIGVGLLKSPVYAQNYFMWISQDPTRIDAFLRMMRFRL